MFLSRLRCPLRHTQPLHVLATAGLYASLLYSGLLAVRARRQPIRGGCWVAVFIFLVGLSVDLQMYLYVPGYFYLLQIEFGVPDNFFVHRSPIFLISYLWMMYIVTHISINKIPRPVIRLSRKFYCSQLYSTPSY